MVLPLAWLSRCCRHLLLPSWAPTLQGSWRCCSQGPRSSTEKTSSTHSGKMSPSREPQPHPTAELAQAEELLEQQLELYQALVEGQEGAWEAQALVLKTQKLKEQMRRHREAGRSRLSFPSVAPSPSSPDNCTTRSPVLGSATSQPLPGPKKTQETATKSQKLDSHEKSWPLQSLHSHPSSTPPADLSSQQGTQSPQEFTLDYVPEPPHPKSNKGMERL